MISKRNISTKRILRGAVTLVAVIALALTSIALAGGGFNDGSKSYTDQSGKEYSIVDIFSDYNVFLFGNLTTSNHIEGGIVVGGDVKRTSGYGALNFGDLSTTTSYIRGNLDINNFNNKDGGTLRLMQQPNDTVMNMLKNKTNSDSVYYIEKLDDKKYIDFDAAYKSLLKESSNIYSLATKLKIGSTENAAVRYDKADINKVNIDLSKITSSNNNILLDYTFFSGKEYYQNVINFTGKLSTVCYIGFYNLPGNKEITMPATYLNGNQIGNYDRGNSLGIVFNLFDVNKIYMSDMSHYGHIIGVGANVYTTTSNYNGCIIANDFSGEAEGHMYGKFGGPVPTPTPSPKPSIPSVKPSVPPKPSVEPSVPPKPSVEPSVPPKPSVEPSVPPKPSVEPSVPPKPSVEPSVPPSPSVEPSVPPKPSVEPSIVPSPSITPTASIDIPEESTPANPPSELAKSPIIIDDDTPAGGLPETGTRSAEFYITIGSLLVIIGYTMKKFNK